MFIVCSAVSCLVLCCVCRKEEGWSHIVRCEGTKVGGTNCWEKVYKYALNWNSELERWFVIRSRMYGQKLDCT